MDGKFQGIMHMPYNFMFRMVKNGEMPLILRLNRSKNIKNSKILAMLSMRTANPQMHPRSIKKLEYTLCLMSNIVGKSKARHVADGHLTKEPNETVYSGVVFRNLRLTMLLAELNGQQLWGSDVGNASLQALTKQKILKHYKDMFLLCTMHSMVQDLWENVGMTNILIFCMK